MKKQKTMLDLLRVELGDVMQIRLAENKCCFAQVFAKGHCHGCF